MERAADVVFLKRVILAAEDLRCRSALTVSLPIWHQIALAKLVEQTNIT